MNECLICDSIRNKLSAEDSYAAGIACQAVLGGKLIASKLCSNHLGLVQEAVMVILELSRDPATN